MGSVRDDARKLYQLMKEKMESCCIRGRLWEVNEITELIHYDVLKFISVVYIFSSKEKRSEVIQGIEKIFGLGNGLKYVKNIIAEINPTNYMEELYNEFSNIVNLMLDYDKEGWGMTNKAYYFQEYMEIYILGIMSENDRASADMNFMMYRAWAEKNRRSLEALGIKKSKIITKSLPKYSLIREKYDGEIPEYEMIEKDIDIKAYEIYLAVKKDILGGKFYEYAESNDVMKGKRTVKEYKLACKCMRGIGRNIHEQRIYELENDINKPYKMKVIDLRKFDIKDFIIEEGESEKITILHKEIKLQNTSYKKDSYEVDSLFNKVVKYLKNDYNQNYDFSNSKVIQKSKISIGREEEVLKEILGDIEAFSQWIGWLTKGEIILTENKAYIIGLFYLAINQYIYKEQYDVGLVVLAKILNHYYNEPKKWDKDANLLFEWLKGYWVLFCPNIEYREFKQLLHFNIVYYSEQEDICYAKTQFMVDMSKMQEGKEFDFYKYHCAGRLLSDKRLLELMRCGRMEYVINNVHIELQRLWKKYDRRLCDDFKVEKTDEIYREREIFYSCVWQVQRRIDIGMKFSRRKYADNESTIGYSTSPRIEYKQKEIHNRSSRFLIEYIIKNVEYELKKILEIPTRKIDVDKELYRLFPYTLYEDNIKSGVIKNTIKKAVYKSCDELGMIIEEKKVY